MEGKEDPLDTRLGMDFGERIMPDCKLPHRVKFPIVKPVLICQISTILSKEERMGRRFITRQ